MPDGAPRPRYLSIATYVVLTFLLSASSRGEAISRRGGHLADVLDGMDVERRWQPGDPVDWRTGEHDPTAVPLNGHCSAFVAAVCTACGVYILRPPDHPELLLANAQSRWLRQTGRRQGWKRLSDGVTAQHRANQGDIVVACYENPDGDDSGHIAVVHPSTKSRNRIKSEGPEITQAGAFNCAKTSLRSGFRFHPDAWGRGKIRYYAHVIRCFGSIPSIEIGGSAPDA